MPQLLVRSIDDDLLQRLKARARANRRSAEAEHRAILEEALRPTGHDFWESARLMQEQTRGRSHTDSAALIRADRDRDGHAPDACPPADRP